MLIVSMKISNLCHVFYFQASKINYKRKAQQIKSEMLKPKLRLILSIGISVEIREGVEYRSEQKPFSIRVIKSKV